MRQERPGWTLWIKVAKTLAVLVLLAGVSLAAAAVKGVLFPDWSGPTAGTYDKPSAVLGKTVRAGRPWSITTMASSIDGKPLKGKSISVVGEIVDLSCYLQVGKDVRSSLMGYRGGVTVAA